MWLPATKHLATGTKLFQNEPLRENIGLLVLRFDVLHSGAVGNQVLAKPMSAAPETLRTRCMVTWVHHRQALSPLVVFMDGSLKGSNVFVLETNTLTNRTN